jgi:hypothetical protein
MKRWLPKIGDILTQAASEAIKVNPEEREEASRRHRHRQEELNTAQASSRQPPRSSATPRPTSIRSTKTSQDKNAEYVTAQEQLEEISNQTAIVQARQTGLVAEVERLTNQVGQLEEANIRSLASKAVA